jgi:hypothetical protein
VDYNLDILEREGYIRRHQKYWLKLASILAIDEWLQSHDIFALVDSGSKKVGIDVSRVVFDRAKRMTEESLKIAASIFSNPMRRGWVFQRTR